MDGRFTKRYGEKPVTAQWIDISRPIYSGMVHWPGDPEVKVERVAEIPRGDPCTVSLLSICAHAGTHVDAPLHYLAAGQGVDQVPIDAMVGPARVVEIADPDLITHEELARHCIVRGERILFKTSNSTRCWARGSFVEDFVHLSRKGARFLVDQGARTVGVDYLSVGGYRESGSEVHHILLEAGIWIIEGLDLTGVAPGEYELLCLPLKVADGDGAPARAVLRPWPNT